MNPSRKPAAAQATTPEAEVHALRARVAELERALAEARSAAASGPVSPLLYRQTEERLGGLVQSNMIGIGFWESDGRIAAVNDALLALIGYTRAEFERGDIPWDRLTPPEYYASDEKAFAQAQETGHCTPYEKEYLRRDGTRVPVLLGGGAFGARRDHGAFYVIDLSDRRRAEEALARSEEQRRVAMAAAQVGTWRWELDGDRETRDATLNALLGLEPVESTQPVSDFLARVHPDDRSRVAAARRAAVAAGAGYDLDLRVTHADGRVRWLRDRGEVVRDEEGVALYMTGACSDLTERKTAEEERGRLLEAEREARAVAEAAERQAAFLAEAGRVLSSSLDYETTLAALADLVVPEFADWCAIDVMDDDGTARRLVIAHRDPAKVEAAWTLHERFPQDPDTVAGIGGVLRTGEPQLVPEVSAEYTARVARDEEHQELLRGLALRSLMILPLAARDRTLGVISFGTAESGRRYGAEDLRVAERLARRAALAVDNARLHRQVQEAGRRREETLRLLDAVLAAAPVALAFVDRGLRYVRVNAALAAIDGLPEHEIVGRTIREVVPDLAASVEPYYHRVFATGQPVLGIELSGRVPGAPGGMRHFLVSYYPILDEQGRVAYVGLVAADLTERKSAEEALRESEERFRTIFSQVGVGIAYTSLDGEFRLVNERFARMLGRGADELAGRPVREVTHPASIETGAEAVREAIRSGAPVAVEKRYLHADGSEVLAHATLTATKGPDGRPGAIVAIVEDITERRRAEEALRRAQKLESIGVLAGGIAHDFNNLLTGILGNASLALRALRPENRPRMEPLLEDVIRASERAAALTQQLLAYAGKGRFFIQPVDLGQLVPEIVQLVRASISKKVEIVVDIGPADLPPVEADASQLQQLVMNLVINGAEAAGEESGRVVIAARPLAVDAAAARARFPGFELAPGAYVELTVADTGVGMDAATVAQIFDPFFTTKFTGRGLGLAAALGIVRGHRGAIRVESTPGKGSRFTVLLPAAGAAAELPASVAAAPPASGRAPSRARGAVLVVDDERMVRDLVREVLEEDGWRVLEAGDGREALAVLEQHATEVRAVLLDLTMPVMGGEEALPALLARKPGLPVVLTSGYGEQSALERIAGARPAFLQKPFTADALLAALRDAVAGGPP